MTELLDAAAEADGGLAPLRTFVRRLEGLVDEGRNEAGLLEEGGRHLRALLADDAWLPATHAAPDPQRYQQYLLYRDPRSRFSVVSFVWGPGQHTPVHDHTIWGLVGVLRGAEIAESFERRADGLHWLGTTRLEVGDVEAVSPTIGDIHRVSNGIEDGVSVSIHVYGADIGQVSRSVYQADGTPKTFISGYADAPALDLWND